MIRNGVKARCAGNQAYAISCLEPDGFRAISIYYRSPADQDPAHGYETDVLKMALRHVSPWSASQNSNCGSEHAFSLIQSRNESFRRANATLVLGWRLSARPQLCFSRPFSAAPTFIGHLLQPKLMLALVPSLLRLVPSFFLPGCLLGRQSSVEPSVLRIVFSYRMPDSVIGGVAAISPQDVCA
jgi:hypothetical protein